ncbi:fasciclin domain-containing protein [Gracilimonas mengyeensis]|uniref:Uncaracterized surface protein containing fasciclin (FAS1) repeats n=1 Tax=Gracilimonas mengyeensis TaxID=1302730 RepID=A0A521C8E9_9BACT|nr:fasciclin domain-containing protein [Gracilimonas mengyeensis]SMO55081.1 Uncaracterized surface protein containing fasciclin (FAS1) repeats [Gracilimonas mengyeensis]
MNNIRYMTIGVTAVLSIIISASAAVQAQNVIEVIRTSEQHTIFAELLAETQMDELLTKEGPFTVLAPTDAAFENMGAELAEIRKNKDQLQNLVIGHLFNDEIPPSEIEQAKNVNVTQGNLKASNGTVHVIDEVLID